MVPIYDLPYDSHLQNDFPFDVLCTSNANGKLHSSIARSEAGRSLHRNSTDNRSIPNWTVAAVPKCLAANTDVSDFFWDNLVGYSDHRQRYELRWINNRVQVQPHIATINTWSLSERRAAISVPTASEQTKGNAGIAAWFLAYLNRKPLIPEVNSEPAVQGEVLHGIIEPMNALLKVKSIATEV